MFFIFAMRSFLEFRKCFIILAPPPMLKAPVLHNTYCPEPDREWCQYWSPHARHILKKVKHSNNIKMMSIDFQMQGTNQSFDFSNIYNI